MDDEQPRRAPSLTDTFELATAQVFALILSACAGICTGVAWFNAVGVDGYEMEFPFQGVLSFVISGAAVALSIAVVGRFETPRSETVRTAVMAALLQVLASGIVGVISGFMLTAGRVDFLAPLQTIIAWSGYGLLVGGGLQATTALVAVLMLVTEARKRR